MSFVLLGLFPLFAKWFVDWVRAQRVYRGFKKPKSFDTDMGLMMYKGTHSKGKPVKVKIIKAISNKQIHLKLA